jgi:peptidoglycan/LPS O-acetylase OafA/YrhL
MLSVVTFTYNFFAGVEGRAPIYHDLYAICFVQQFYLFFPLVFAATRGGRSIAPILGLIGFGLAARIVEFVLASRMGAEPGVVTFYWSFGQFDAFGIGALIALRGPALQRPARYLAVLLAAAVVLVAVLALDGAANRDGLGMARAVVRAFVFPTKQPPGGAMPVTTYLVVVAIVAALLATAIGPDNLVKRVLGWAPLAAIGRISYGVYAWQMLVIVAAFALFGRTVDGASTSLRLLLALPVLAVTIGVAAASYRLYEMRFHRRIGT